MMSNRSATPATTTTSTASNTPNVQNAAEANPSAPNARRSTASNGPVVVLAGGVGAARFLRGVVRAVPPSEITVIVNTGDDRLFYGAHVSPDLDIVTYTLADRINPQFGFGLKDDRFELVDRLAALGHDIWFRLGDADYANSVHRSLRLAEGIGLDEIADELRRDMGLALRILPMSNDPCPTFIQLSEPDGRKLHFEEYLVREGSPTNVESTDLSAAQEASPAPNVIAAIEAAETILVSPSNPIVSIGPILAVQGIRDALKASSAPIVAVSPIVGGAPIKGPAHTLLAAKGVEVSAFGVANFYRDWIDGFVFDQQDQEETSAIEALGLRAMTLDTLMVNAEISETLARATFAVADGLR